jgi:hypothetical protein
MKPFMKVEENFCVCNDEVLELISSLRKSMEREKTLQAANSVLQEALTIVSEFTADYSNTLTTEAKIAREALKKAEEIK